MESNIKIVCDSTNNTPESITERKLTVDIYFKPHPITDIIDNVIEAYIKLLLENGKTEEECLVSAEELYKGLVSQIGEMINERNNQTS